MSAADVLVVIIRNLIVIGVLLTFAPLLIWLERKGSAYIQDRPGPERAHIGPFRLAGLLHVVGDAAKLFTKEDITPAQVNKFYYYLAPLIVVAVGFLTVAVVPFCDDIVMPNGFTIGGQMLNLNVGILWFFAIVSLSVYGIIFAGWASNSKYSLLGGMRASAGVLSYEIPMGLSIVAVLMYYGTVSLQQIVVHQGGTWWGWLPHWGIFIQPIAAIIFTVCAFAEANRTPFDLAEAEGELVAGHHTEYSSMKFGMIMLSEYIAFTVSSALITTIWFGGWQVPWVDTAALIKYAQPGTEWILGIAFGLGLIATVLSLSSFQANFGRWKDMRDYEGLIMAFLILGGALTALLLLFVCMAFTLPAWYGPIFAAVVQFHVFLAKLFFFCWVFVWVRWTVPRFRYDQLMNLGWKLLLPLALANILVTGLVITVVK